MLKTLAKIRGNSVKAIYLVIRFHGTATFQDLLDAGFGESVIYNAVKKLQEGQFIYKVGKGVYRYSGTKFFRSMAEFAGGRK